MWLVALQVINVTPRYAKLRAEDKKQFIGWENIELISDRPLETMLDEFKRLKEEFPDRCAVHPASSAKWSVCCLSATWYSLQAVILTVHVHSSCDDSISQNS